MVPDRSRLYLYNPHFFGLSARGLPGGLYNSDLFRPIL
jgi:hypothetical protein